MVRYIEDPTELIDEILRTLLDDKVGEIAVVVDSKRAKDIFRMVWEHEDAWVFEMQGIELPYEDDIPVLLKFSSDGEIWVEVATKHNGDFLAFDAEVCYVDFIYYKDVVEVANCNKYICITFEELFDDEEDDTEVWHNGEGLRIITDDEGKACGITIDYKNDNICMYTEYHDSRGLSTAFLSDIIDYYLELSGKSQDTRIKKGKL